MIITQPSAQTRKKEPRTGEGEEGGGGGGASDRKKFRFFFIIFQSALIREYISITHSAQFYLH